MDLIICAILCSDKIKELEKEEKKCAARAKSIRTRKFIIQKALFVKNKH